jgi:hypothetical protein
MTKRKKQMNTARLTGAVTARASRCLGPAAGARDSEPRSLSHSDRAGDAALTVIRVYDGDRPVPEPGHGAPRPGPARGPPVQPAAALLVLHHESAWPEPVP